MKTIVVSLALAAGMLAMVIVLRGGVDLREPPPEESRGSVRVTQRQAPDVVLAIKPGASRAAEQRPAAAGFAISPVAQELRDAKSLKPLHDRLAAAASRTPEEAYVLAEILNRCARVTDRARDTRRTPDEKARAREQFLATISEKDSNRAARIAAYDAAYVDRCAGIEAVTTEAAIRELLRQAADAGDAKARARLVEKEVWTQLAMNEDAAPRRMANRPAITDAQLAALRQAVESHDVGAFMIAGRVFSSTLADLTVRAGPDERSVEGRLLQDAWLLAACELGTSCGRESGRLLYACAMNGECGAADVREYLFFYAHSPQQSQQVNEYAAALVRAARSGDWSYFTLHRGAPPGNSMSIFMQR